MIVGKEKKYILFYLMMLHAPLKTALGRAFAACTDAA
jgi:hypothetical protein